MKFIADLHIHSKYSRATAKNLDLEALYIEAQKKGITVLSTGDSTHPEWFSELKEKLIPDEGGLLKLRPEIEAACNASVPESCRRDVRFILESEISSIYKKNEKTRKNHNLVYFPDFDSAERFNTKLDAIGNIKSDGRPILGLDTKILLEILLETNPDNFMIPAHIWTPWFSLFGSKSGFNSMEECFEDLKGEIFAVETGLSSDPPMNWRVSDLDGMTLVSNSDAHSPAKLGREANLFDTEFSYMAIRNALKTGDPEKFLGTIEFFPEEGKYHNDGHRKCNISMTPELSAACNGICPECGKPLTLGVNYRVHELADRKEGFVPENAPDFQSIIPLDEIISEITGTGPKTKRVLQCLGTAVEKLGSEFDILRNISIDEIKASGIPLLGEAIERVREKNLKIEPGYDGEFGKIQIFTEDEKEELRGQKMLFAFKGTEIPDTKAPSDNPFEVFKKKKPKAPKANTVKKNGLNENQEKAVLHEEGPVMIVAGPGTGKTHTITQKIARLISEKKVNPESILAITFTNKAAFEMRSRIKKLTEKTDDKMPFTSTFHSLCFTLLKATASFSDFTIADKESRDFILESAMTAGKISAFPISFKKVSAMIETAKQKLLSPDDDLGDIVSDARLQSEFTRIYKAYNLTLYDEKRFDYEDLIFQTVKQFENDAEFMARCKSRFSYFFVDEYQDLNYGQYKIVKALAAPGSNICVIGDPDQAVYGFRGSDPSYFKKFTDDYPNAATIGLTQNYRSTETILEASAQVVNKDNNQPQRERLWSGIEGPDKITLLQNATEKSEATAIGKIIEKMIGGTGFHSIDFGKADTHTDRELSFSDFAVLVRTSAQAKSICEAFEKGGIPFQHVSRESIYKLKAVSGLISAFKLLNGIHPSMTDKSRLTAITKLDFNEIKSSFGLFNKEAGSIEIQDQLIYLQQNVTGINDEIRNCKKAEEAFYHILKLSEPFGVDINDFLKTIALESDPDIYDYKAEKVAVMTMHASKGLEFPVVFIAGCEHGIIPFIRSEKEPPDFDEERRLFYVAMTRARENLFLSYADKRFIFGKAEDRKRSPYIRDINGNIVRHETPAFGNIEKTKKPVQMMLF